MPTSMEANMEVKPMVNMEDKSSTKQENGNKEVEVRKPAMAMAMNLAVKKPEMAMIKEDEVKKPEMTITIGTENVPIAKSKTAQIPKTYDEKIAEEIVKENTSTEATILAGTFMLPVIAPLEPTPMDKEIKQDNDGKPHDPWHDFDDKFLLFEHRYPELTKEDFQEINREDAMPLNFLKGFTMANEKEFELFPLLKQSSSQHIAITPDTIPETPIYITIPIVINSHSNLPISLSIGGTEVPLSLSPKEKDSVASIDKMDKPLAYISPPQRPINRHRNNFKARIYARSRPLADLHLS
uniref:Uncharacterized protein n=1 Tax=Stomoxys calcitrans TaxID=35570 RepID=A0A1I8Q8L6_STOCA